MASPTVSTIPTGPDTFLTDTFPVISAPRLPTVVSIQYFTSTKLYFTTSKLLLLFSSIEAINPSVFVEYGSGVTLNVFSSPFLSTRKVTSFPSPFTSFITVLSSPALFIFLPLISFIISPAFKPDLSNALPSVTSDTSAEAFSLVAYENPKRYVL